MLVLGGQIFWPWKWGLYNPGYYTNYKATWKFNILCNEAFLCSSKFGAKHVFFQSGLSFSALMLLDGRQERHLPLTISCSSKIQIGFFPFWYRLTWVVPEKGPLNGCVCVCLLLRPNRAKMFDFLLEPVVSLQCNMSYSKLHCKKTVI